MEQDKSQELLLSVDMITYNHEAFIEKAIEGVLMQKTNFRYELVIGEDCSTDSTRILCEEYAKKNPSIIRLLPSVRNLGMFENGIRTFNACMGKYIALCDGDDYWTDPEKLQKQVDFLERNPDTSIVHTAYDVFYEKNQILIINFHNYRNLVIPQGFILKDLVKLNFIGILTVCVRKDSLLQAIDDLIARDWPLNLIFDKTLWLEISIKHKIGYIPDSTAVRRILQNSATRSTNDNEKVKIFLRSNKVALYYSYKFNFYKNCSILLMQRLMFRIKLLLYQII